MRQIALLLLLMTLTSCYRPDSRVVGRFQASGGEVLDIGANGYIRFLRQGHPDERVGLVTISSEQPLSIGVIAPDTSPLIGTKIIFTADRQTIHVDWPQSPRTGQIERPSTFRKE